MLDDTNATEYYSTFKIMNLNAGSFIHIIFFKSQTEFSNFITCNGTGRMSRQQNMGVFPLDVAAVLVKFS